MNEVVAVAVVGRLVVDWCIVVTIIDVVVIEDEWGVGKLI